MANEFLVDPEPEEAPLLLEMCDFTRHGSRVSHLASYDEKLDDADTLHLRGEGEHVKLHMCDFRESHKEERYDEVSLTCCEKLCAAAQDIIVLLAAGVWLLAGLIMASGPWTVVRDEWWEVAAVMEAEYEHENILDGTSLADARAFFACLSAALIVVSLLVCLCGACCEERKIFESATSTTETRLRKNVHVETVTTTTATELGPLKCFLIMYGFISLLMGLFLVFVWSYEDSYADHFKSKMEDVIRAVNRICMDAQMAKVKMGCHDWSGPEPAELLFAGITTTQAPVAHIDSSIAPAFKILLSSEMVANMPPERALLQQLGASGCPLIQPLCIPPDDFNITTACVCRGAQYHSLQTDKWEGTYCSHWNGNDTETKMYDSHESTFSIDRKDNDTQWCYVNSQVSCGRTVNLMGENASAIEGNVSAPSKPSDGPCTSEVESRSKLILDLFAIVFQKLHVLFVAVGLAGSILLVASLCSFCLAASIHNKEQSVDDPYDPLHEDIERRSRDAKQGRQKIVIKAGQTNI